MAKTYSKVERNFLEEMMRQMAFNEHWISLIRICIRIVSYVILINGKPSITFRPKRGICQDDPISSYLFLMCAKGLSSLLFKAKREGQIKWIKIAEGCQPLSHLQFADDYILFCRTSISKCQHIQTILETYKVAYGQSINKQKTSIFFNSNTCETIKNQIKEITGVTICHYPGTYLGLPSVIGKLKCKTFGSLKDMAPFA